MTAAPETPAPGRPRPLHREAFRAFVPITTRWSDNDVYGHVNNVVFYSFFDTAVNRHLIERGALDIECGEVIGLVVHSQCHYFAPLAFPQAIDAGLRVIERGRSSVRYGVGIFADGAPWCAAHGEFVHVYVDRATRRPTALPDSLTSVLDCLA
jgi:acyl-CoA thioester hydrolase